jgi:NitT/TauT family transport system ATP-binding protein
MKIQLQSVSKVFDGNIQALSPLSLEIATGEFVSLMGPSGCGKSTLLRLISGLEKPSSGTVLIPAEMKSFGFVFQDSHLLPWRTLEENIRLPLEFQKISRAEAQSRITEVIQLIGLEDFRRARPSQLSGGMKMRASLARALVTNPQILLLDEPFAAVDEILRDRLDQELRRIWKTLGITVIFVTHSVSEAVFVSNRLIALSPRPGRIVKDEMIDLPLDRGSNLKWTESFLNQMTQITKTFESMKELR